MLEAVFFSAAAGILGTGLGGAAACALRGPSERLLGRLMSFSSGLMIGVVCFELMPEALSAAGMPVSVAGVMAGLLFVIALEKLIPAKAAGGGMLRTGLLIAAGIAAHNFPEGLAIGAGFSSAPELGFSVCAVIAMHDLPEGLAMGVPLRLGGAGAARVIGLAVLSGVPTAFGGLAGYALGGVSAAWVGFSLAFAGGAMLTITCGELIPEAALLDRGPVSFFALCAGFMLALAAVNL